MTGSYVQQVLKHSAPVAPDKSGVLISLTREQANWKTINFSVRRLVAGQHWQSDTRD
jgi:5-deoxy-D-glucuronate isomerase